MKRTHKFLLAIATITAIIVTACSSPQQQNSPYEEMLQNRIIISDIVDSVMRQCDSNEITLFGQEKSTWENDFICVYKHFMRQCESNIKNENYSHGQEECKNESAKIFREKEDQTWIGDPERYPKEQNEAEKAAQSMSHSFSMGQIRATAILSGSDCGIFKLESKSCILAAIHEVCEAAFGLHRLVITIEECKAEALIAFSDSFCAGWITLPEEQLNESWITQTLAICEIALAPYGEEHSCYDWLEEESENRCERKAIKEECEKRTNTTLSKCEEYAIIQYEHSYDLPFDWMKYGVEYANQIIETEKAVTSSLETTIIPTTSSIPVATTTIKSPVVVQFTTTEKRGKVTMVGSTSPIVRWFANRNNNDILDFSNKDIDDSTSVIEELVAFWFFRDIESGDTPPSIFVPLQTENITDSYGTLYTVEFDTK